MSENVEEISTESEELLDLKAEKLVQIMVDRGLHSIAPKIEQSGISYLSISELLPGEKDIQIKSLLDKMTRSGILNAKLIDKVVMCPSCRGASILAKYNCPRCESIDIGRASIIEHIRCGYLDSKDKFEKGGALICPKCKGVVRESDYRKIGSSFQCNSCGSRFESPKIKHRCMNCQEEFTYKDALYESVFEYSLSEATKKNVAKGTLPLISIVNALKDGGYDVSQKAQLQGRSGAMHTFDVVARKEKRVIVASLSFEPKEEEIIGLFGKKYDVDPSHTLLVTLTPPSKEEEAVSKAYGVKILCSTGTQSLAEQIYKILNE